MFQNVLLFTILAVGLAVSDVKAAPHMAERSGAHASIGVRANFKHLKSGTRIIDADRARVKALKERAAKSKDSKSKRAGVFSFDVTNEAVTYLASVDVGSPATTFNLLIDTGSSNTWVGADTPFTETQTTTCNGDEMEVIYGSGLVFGLECTDQVALSPDLVIPEQGIGVALIQEGFGDGIDGILGIGPVDLTDGTTLDGEEVPTVTQNLFNQGTITSNIVSVFFAPSNEEESTNGQLTFGGVDTSKATSDITFVPITSTSPANEFWGIDESISFGGTTILPTTAGIVDTGTTLVLIATDAFNTYTTATGATLDENTGLLRITPAQFANLQPLDFNIGGETFTLTPNAQAFPRALNTDIGGTNDFVYLIVNDIGSDLGEGLDFINGYAFLERFLSVFDTDNSQVGFAATAQTDSTIN
ncbi:acid protease [Punctularia strigosozonata HHB-11173 SS5]|uniref:acid protease n=1 Tax=Punctularia strigosozonata (strain HHB-11173) TaxID=741275 RepID=UPI0004416AA9|nr:acid protease [Punctularia strigosozonata HHB-11173 SS5]EIN11545.1 acid protease [Punctularia strigosozonata HHB-11173 SS5]